MILIYWIVIIIGFFLTISFIQIYIRRPWLGNYLKYRLRHRAPKPTPENPIHIIFCFVDHFEPKENCKDLAIQKARMEAWYERYPKIANKYHDADRRFPQHTWFYQVEDWETSDLDLDYLKMLADLTYWGTGEVELHIHHNQPQNGFFPEVNSGEKLENLIEQMKDFFSQTGALVTAEENPQKIYGFIHGMFALDNAHGGEYCGVNNEFEVLEKTGCYADFTMPAGVYIAQSKKINSIYYVEDNPEKPRSHDSGIDVEVNKSPSGNVLSIQGPMWVNFFKQPRKWKVSVENANVDAAMPPITSRVDRWIQTNVHVKGQPNWVFVKIHTHGTREDSFPVYFDEPADEMFRHLTEKYNDGNHYVLHFVTAREAYNIVKAAEAGCTGNPNDFRDYLVKPYANSKIRTNAHYKLKSWTTNSCSLEIKNSQSNISLEFKEMSLKRIQVEELATFTLEDLREDNLCKLELSGKGRCNLEMRDRPIRQCTINGKPVRADNTLTIETSLARGKSNIELSY